MDCQDPTLIAEASRRSVTYGDEWAQVAAFTELQVETLIDAILYATTAADVVKCTHQRNVGEFAARMAQQLGGLLDPVFVRRVAVLSVAPDTVLNLIPELRFYADIVRYLETGEFVGDNALCVVIESIIKVAARFHDLIAIDGVLPAPALRALMCDDSLSQEFVAALARSFHLSTTLSKQAPTASLAS